MVSQNCLFCKILAKEIPSKIVYEDKTAIAFEDIKPQAPTHILIIPRAHIEKVSDLSEEDSGLMGHLIFIAKKIAKEAGVADSGYRIVINCNKNAAQEVFHLHVHLLGGRIFSWPPG